MRTELTAERVHRATEAAQAMQGARLPCSHSFSALPGPHKDNHGRSPFLVAPRLRQGMAPAAAAGSVPRTLLSRVQDQGKRARGSHRPSCARRRGREGEPARALRSVPQPQDGSGTAWGICS